MCSLARYVASHPLQGDLLIVRQIVLGSIATKCPSMALAPSALSNLDSALNLFNDVSTAGNARAAKVLVS